MAGKVIVFVLKRTCKMMQNPKFDKNDLELSAQFAKTIEGDDRDCDRIWKGGGKDVERWTGREPEPHADSGW